MSKDSIEVVQNRNAFYRDNYKRILVVLICMVVVNVCLVGILFYQITHEPVPEYFAMSSTGKIVKLHGLNQPVLAPDVVLQWAERSAVSVFSYNSLKLNRLNYRKLKCLNFA